MDLGKKRVKRGTFEDDNEREVYRVQPKKIPVEIPDRVKVPLQAPKEVPLQAPKEIPVLQ